MSDQIGAAAAALGIPEPLVERSAAARAAETGSSTEEILAAWAGGEAAPAPAAQDAPEEPAEEAADEAAQETPSAEPAPPEIVIEAPVSAPSAAVEPLPAGPYKPPVLVGARDNPMTVLAGAIGLFLIIFLVGFVGPSIQGEAPGTRTSEIQYSAQALDGREVYTSANCASCHTQMVRPIIADVGLGAVTVHDSNQVIGIRRFGPDLSDVGARLSESQLEAIVTGLGEHPAYSLSSEDMNALVAYLAESQTAQGSGG